MREVIGIWIISLAVTSMIFSVEPDFSIKEKVLGVIGIMLFVTLVCFGSLIIAG